MSGFSLLSNLEKTVFTAEEIYDPKFASFYSTISKIICAIAMSFTLLLTYIITTKTPPFMSNLKVYLIPYCIYSLTIEAVWILYTPIILHPFVYFYPTGVAKNFHPKLGIVIVGIGGAAAISLLDCCIGILLERTIVLRNIEMLKSEFSTIFIPYLNIAVTAKIPFFTFILLSLSSLGCLVLANIVTFVHPLYVYFIVPSENIQDHVHLHIKGLEKYLNLEYLLIFQGTAQNSFPLFIVFGGIFALLRGGIALLLIPYNTYKSYKLNFIMSSETKKSNLMLLKMCYLQFTGLFLFLFCPVVIVGSLFLLVQTPTKYINYCFVVMGFFNIYDTIITIACIKPYRMFILSFLKFEMFSQKKIIIPQSGPA